MNIKEQIKLKKKIEERYNNLSNKIENIFGVLLFILFFIGISFCWRLDIHLIFKMFLTIGVVILFTFLLFWGWYMISDKSLKYILKDYIDEINTYKINIDDILNQKAYTLSNQYVFEDIKIRKKTILNDVVNIEELKDVDESYINYFLVLNDALSIKINKDLFEALNIKLQTDDVIVYMDETNYNLLMEDNDVISFNFV